MIIDAVLRIPIAVYERVVEAAQAVGAPLNQFLVQSALEKANQILNLSSSDECLVALRA